jgi:hypothetical protein
MTAIEKRNHLRWLYRETTGKWLLIEDFPSPRNSLSAPSAS